MIAARGLPLIYIVSILGVLSLVTTCLRCFVRYHLLRAYGLDDFLMTCACILYMIFGALVILGVYFGVGAHMSELNDNQRYNAMLFWWIAYMFYGIIITLCKISVGLFLLRVSIQRKQRLLLWHAIHVTILAGIIFVFVVAFQCTPVSFFWTRFLEEEHRGKCIGIRAYVALGYWFSAICVVTDFIFGFMPFFLVRKLNLAMREKVVLVPILSMAAFASFAPLVRMAYIETLRSPDFLYATTPIALWSTLEPGVAIVASCLATLRPLIRQIQSRSTTEQDPTSANINSARFSSLPDFFPTDEEAQQPRWSFREKARKLIGARECSRGTKSAKDTQGNSTNSTESRSSRGLKVVKKSVSTTPLATMSTVLGTNGGDESGDIELEESTRQDSEEVGPVLENENRM